MSAPGQVATTARRHRRRFGLVAIAALGWAVHRAGVGSDIVNGGGWSSFARFWRAVTSAELSAEFVRLTWNATLTTLAFATLGALLSLLLGAAGALGLSELFVGRGIRWRSVRVAMLVPRAVHEVLWALLLVHVFGFTGWSAVLAIAIPFGAVSAKVFAETLDVADRDPFDALRAAGTTRWQAVLYGVLPAVRGDLLSYAFYRFECAVRSAAVLGVIGVGGLGFQLDLSFESLRYHEIWTLIAALMILSGGAEVVATTVRRSRSSLMPRITTIAVSMLVVLSFRWADIGFDELTSTKIRGRAADLGRRLFPPRLGPGRWGELLDATLDTVAMSLLATTIAASLGLLVAMAARRPESNTRHPMAAITRFGLRVMLLLSRAVPSPVWVFLFLLVLFAGAWPGVVGLAIYNMGVLGRLFAETLEETDQAPATALAALGAGPIQRVTYGVLPTAAPRLMALTLYRWEVITRETIVVGVVGAGGLGQLINEHLAARDFAAVTGAIGALIVVALVIDSVSAATRRLLR